MQKDNDILFVRVNILDNWRFWNQYAVREDYEGAGREVIAQANALLSQDTLSNERAAELLNEAGEFRRKRSEAGKKGGDASAKARWGFVREEEPETKKPDFNPYQRIKPPESRDEVFNFANDSGIPDWCAIEFYEMNSSRGWKDRNGKDIYNWKGALVKYHKSKKEAGK